MRLPARSLCSESTSNTPPFTNLFVKLIVSIFDIDSNRSTSLSELKNSSDLVRQKIETDKKRIEADFQILRYSLVGSLLKEILGLFVSRKKQKEDPPASKTS